MMMMRILAIYSMVSGTEMRKKKEQKSIKQASSLFAKK
jgi:hypothetical protein